jgi:hypothetical protein
VVHTRRSGGATARGSSSPTKAEDGLERLRQWPRQDGVVTGHTCAPRKPGLAYAACAYRWVFGDRDTGAYLPNPAWTDIVRHTLVKGRASVDDPDLTRYWAQRRRRVKPPLDSYTVRLLSKQDGRCTLCGDDLLTFEDPPQTPQGWEWWYLWVTKKAIAADYLVHHDQPGMSRDRRTHLVHAHCSRRHPVRAAAGTTMKQKKARTALAACLGRMRGNALVRS